MIKIYHQNGTVSESESFTPYTGAFSIQYDSTNELNPYLYSGDKLLWEIDQSLNDVLDLFVSLYFTSSELFDEKSSIIPLGLALGGQNSDISIDKLQFLKLLEQYTSYSPDLYRYLYVTDCQYLVSSIKSLLQSVDFCFIQYYTQITNIDCWDYSLGEELMVCSPKTRQLIFYLETFFTKIYSILDLMVKIIFELENPITHFSTITKLRSSEKTWGSRKHLHMNNLPATIFEDCSVIRQIESLRNEAVHNGTWEFAPKVFLRVKKSAIVERYMLFPDFEDGHLTTVKNRRHFFSSSIKVNDALVSIHEEFYYRLFSTLQYITKFHWYTDRNSTTEQN